MWNLLKALLLLAVPLAIFYAGGYAMSCLSGREVTRGLPRDDPRTPLNLRATGYDAEAVAANWNTMDEARLTQERTFLEVDLVFPFLYGGAFLAALLLGWAMVGRPFAAWWLVLPVALVVVADWTENLVHLAQLERWTALGREPATALLSTGWIRLASVATTVKICASGGVLVLLLYLAVRVATDR